LTGSDRRVEKNLKEITCKIVDKYVKMAGISVIPYKTLIERLEKSAKMLQDSITITERVLGEKKNIENEIYEEIAVTDSMTEVDASNYVEIDLKNILLHRIIKEKTLSLFKVKGRLRSDMLRLESIQRQLLMYRMFLDGIKEYNTELIGE